MNDDVLIFKDPLPDDPIENAIYLSPVDDEYLEIIVTDVFGRPRRLKQSKVKTIRATVDNQTNVFQDDRLIGVEIVGYFGLNQVQYDFVKDGILFEPEFGTLNFSAVGGLYAGDKLLIVITEGQNAAQPAPQPVFEYLRKKEKFTGSTDVVLQLSHEILSSEEPQVFYNGLLVDDVDFIVGTDTITLKFLRENDAIIHIYFVAKITN